MVSYACGICLTAIRLKISLLSGLMRIPTPQALGSGCKVRKKNRNNRQFCEKSIVERFCKLSYMLNRLQRQSAQLFFVFEKLVVVIKLEIVGEHGYEAAYLLYGIESVFANFFALKP